MIIKNKRGIAPGLVVAALGVVSVHSASATEFDFSYSGLTGGAAINAAIIYSGATITEFKGTSSGLSAYGLGSNFDITSGITTGNVYYGGSSSWVYEFDYAGSNGDRLNIASDQATDQTQQALTPTQHFQQASISTIPFPPTSINLPYGSGSLAATPAPVPGSGPLSYLALAVGILLYNRKRLLGMASSLTIRLSHRASARS